MLATLPSGYAREIVPFFGLIYLGLLFGGSYYAGWLLWIFGAYAVLSVLSLIQYGWDKASAKRKRWRVPEKSLQTLAFLGGWPGSALGQTIFRHKTQKVSFQKTFRLCVAANVLITVAAIVVWVSRR